MSVRYIDTFFRLTRNVNILNYKSLGISNLTFKNRSLCTCRVYIKQSIERQLKIGRFQPNFRIKIVQVGLHWVEMFGLRISFINLTVATIAKIINQNHDYFNHPYNI